MYASSIVTLGLENSASTSTGPCDLALCVAYTVCSICSRLRWYVDRSRDMMQHVMARSTSRGIDSESDRATSTSRERSSSTGGVVASTSARHGHESPPPPSPSKEESLATISSRHGSGRLG